MKKTYIFLIVMIMSASAAFAQFNLRLTYGTLNTKMASFGYKVNDIVAPYIAIDAFMLRLDIEQNGTKLISGNASIVAPMVGSRFYFLEAGNLKGYGNLGIQRIFIGGKATVTEEDYDTGDMLDVEYKLRDILSKKNVWQMQLGFGAEYFFNDNLSLIAEYGFRYITGTFEIEPTKIYVSPSAIYARLGLGFYF